ncbi:MAG: arylsulfatase [Mariniphaga sp.]|jgi:arylsulfatase|nr:arylsulfatase [Mariniphaga sp.]
MQKMNFLSISKTLLVSSGLSILMGACSEKSKTADSHQNAKPNVIYILADDLGYGDLGCYGQQLIETPNIDKLAAEGMLFTQHYSGAPVCAPSRCMLMTGKHPGNAQIRGNDEWGSRGDVWNYLAQLKDSTLEGQRPLKEGTETIAKMMKKAGYATGMVGKWGLGAPHTVSTPTKMGFDFFTGYNCQRQAHTFYPVHLWQNGQKLLLGNDTVAPTTKLRKGADPYDENSYDKFTLQTYSPEVMFSELMGFIERNSAEPFFAYWATPIPHAPLQAPQRWINYYVNKFGNEEPYLGNNGYFPARYPHATYAAMISYLDENVGKLVQRLKELEIYDNTLIIFTSDNGPTYNGGTDSPWFNSGGPFKSEYGWGKGFVHEGGFRVPMIACWPDKIKPGTQSDHISAFWDVMPTLADIAGLPTPETDGISFLPTLTGKEQPEHPYLYWEYPEYGGQQAVRMGKWKGIRKDIKKGNMVLELYNLENDLQEQYNVADEQPEIINKMEDIMQKEHQVAELDRFKMEALGDVPESKQ